MKLRNIKIGDLLYLKTHEEVQESKYFKSVGDRGDVYFTDNSLFYSRNDDCLKGGTLVEVTGIYGEDVGYENGLAFGVSRHAFRKPTKSELEEYHGGKR